MRIDPLAAEQPDKLPPRRSVLRHPPHPVWQLFVAIPCGLMILAVMLLGWMKSCQTHPGSTFSVPPDLLASPLPTVTNSVGMEFARIPAGEFLMGAPETDLLAEPDEQPAHRVILTKDYYLGRFEVTQSQYELVMGQNPSHFSPHGRGAAEVKGKDTSYWPVEFVNWFEANEFCRRLSELPAEQQAGRSYRLPTEAEWEYACRAGTTTRFYYGDQPDSRFANSLRDHGHPLPVGSYPPNPFGLFDMHGNVLEWCSDWHTDDYYAQSPLHDPTGPEIAEDDVRVLRGGGYLFKPASSAFRDRISPYLRGSAHGLRLVMEQDEMSP